jgi:hypothetical protein
MQRNGLSIDARLLGDVRDQILVWSEEEEEFYFTAKRSWCTIMIIQVYVD